MAEKDAKWKENAPGKFYVDDQCIACDACCVEAPGFFEMELEEGFAFVKKQPKNDNELKNCYEALEACPVSAIGDDGEG